ncbi:MAG: biopolymer transporter ExbD [Bacteroidota bacterium]
MRNSRQTPGVNAGSMADIAFLLLIFFLVTTTIPNDKGLVRKLPKKCVHPPCNITQNERNILRIQLNRNGELMVNNDLSEMGDLREMLKEFIDNNGDKSCGYCQGNGFEDASENPQKAIISLAADRESSYKDYIAIQVELTAAYYELREAFIKHTFKKDVALLSEEELKQARDAYPFIISEAEIE